MLTGVVDALCGRKTYLVALGMLAYQILGVYFGKQDHVDWQSILTALGLMTLRAGIAKGPQSP